MHNNNGNKFLIEKGNYVIFDLYFIKLYVNLCKTVYCNIAQCLG